VSTFSCSFGHNRMPTPITRGLNFLNAVPPLHSYAWMVGMIAVK